MPGPCIDEFQSKVPYSMKPPSTPPRLPYQSCFSGSVSNFNYPSSSPSSPPSPSSVSVAESVPSTTSDAEFPRTPSSNRSSGVCRIAYTSAEAESRTPSPSPENVLNQYTDAFRSNYSSSPEDERMFDGFLDNINRDQSTTVDIEQKAMEAYMRHIGTLDANTFHSIVRYLEAIRERQRMRYYTSCWDVVVVQRREAVALSTRDKSKSDYLAVDQELQLILDILAHRLSLPRQTDGDGQYVTAARDNAKVSIRQTDTVLATFKSHAIAGNVDVSG